MQNHLALFRDVPTVRRYRKNARPFDTLPPSISAAIDLTETRAQFSVSREISRTGDIRMVIFRSVLGVRRLIPRLISIEQQLAPSPATNLHMFAARTGSPV